MAAVHTLLWTTNAKMIGTIYLTLSISYGVSGLLLSWLLRGELGALGEQLLFGDNQLYNTLITSLPSWYHDG